MTGKENTIFRSTVQAGEREVFAKYSFTSPTEQRTHLDDDCDA